MRLLLLTTLLSLTLGDIFMTNPKGSNNRLNENGVNRRNGARLFDSQNNNKGGYNVGEVGVEANNEDHAAQFQLEYYGSGPGAEEPSHLVVEWAHQHGCGAYPKVRCNNVIQYMCMNEDEEQYPATDTEEDGEKRAGYMRDGTSTDRQAYVNSGNQESDEAYTERMGRARAALTADRGLQESLLWYDMCNYREANTGLFHADQQLNNNRRSFTRQGYVTSRRTRQNPNGNQRGMECPEERDYYPYWQPTLQGPYDPRSQRTGWIDAAYLGDKKECRFVERHSFNTRTKARCVLPGVRDYGVSITETSCTEEGGTWVSFQSYLEVLEDVKDEAACEEVAAGNQVNKVVWKPLRSDSDVAKCIVKAPAPVCAAASTTRNNHLGNALTNPLYSSRFNMRLPHFPSGRTKRCVLRVRYNITTGDYNPRNTFSEDNGADNSPVTNDPTVNVIDGLGLTLAINTAQFGRTFQDRSHIFKVVARAAGLGPGKHIHNLNVRGQRGNIVQNYPSVEYDFVPDDLTMKKGDLVHIQWAGYNTNPANRAGEGTDATDRNNFVQMEGGLDESYPALIDASNFWSNVQSLTHPEASPRDLAVSLASSGFYCGYEEHAQCPAARTLAGSQEALQGQLNNANASYRGHLLQVKGAGSYFYMCTRNNNFSNRSQKGAITVTDE